MEPIFYDSPGAARQIEAVSALTGNTWMQWVDRLGIAHLSEDAARLSSSTHYRCPKCERVVEKHNCCLPCYAEHTYQMYAEAQKTEWDRERMVYGEIPGLDIAQYLNDDDEILDFCERNGVRLEDVCFYACEPKYAYECQLDGSFFEDILPEDGELPDELGDAIDAFNAAVKQYNRPISWWRSDQAVTVTIDQEGK